MTIKIVKFTAIAAPAVVLLVAAGIYFSAARGDCAAPAGPGVDWTRCALAGRNLEGADLSGARLVRADLSRANLQGAKLRDADLEAAELRGANLAGADLRGAVLFQAKLIDATLTGAKLAGANFTQADISGTALDRRDFFAKASEVVSQATPKFRNRIRLFRQNFDGADLSGLDLSNLYTVELSLRGAKLQRAAFVDSWAVGGNFIGTDLSAAKFDRANLDRAMFDKALLRGADFGIANLSGASFRDTDLRGANLAAVRNLTQAQLEFSCGDERTKLAPGLAVRRCAD